MSTPGEDEGTVRFAVQQAGSADRGGEVVKVIGFGLFDTVGAVTDRQKKGGSIEETAEVWFEKV